MSGWTRREGWHLRLDASLRTYVTQIVHVMADRPDADVLDVAAGSGWLGQLDFRSYTPLDIIPPHERWDLDTPLPEHHVGAYDVVVCLGALHFAADPRWSLAQLRRGLRARGELIVGVPWLYPPHDREHDRWRIAPRQIWGLMREHCGQVSLYPNGSLLHLPMHILNRYIAGPFRGVARCDLDRLRRSPPPERWCPDRVSDIPVPMWRPMGVIAHGSGLSSPERE